MQSSQPKHRERAIKDVRAYYVVHSEISTYLRNRLVIDGDELSRLSVDLKSLIEAQCSLDRIRACG